MWDKLNMDLGPRSVVIGWARSNRLAAAISFSRVSATSAEACIYAEGGIPRHLLDAGLLYAFKQLGLARLTFCIESTNIRSIDFVSRLGAELEATLAGTSPDSDTLIWRLRPSDSAYWRRLNGQEGRERTTSAEL